MVEPIDDIRRQARQGSVAAIIQILNDRLASSGIRARAVLAQGILQLLCEAPKTEQLDQKRLVSRVKQILETIQPRRIRRVRINSRLVREQQLLWLEEITKDPENQLLWTQDITLARPNLIRRWWEDWHSDRQLARQTIPSKSTSRRDRAQRWFWRGIVGGSGISLIMLALGWLVYAQFGREWSQSGEAQVPQVEPQANPDPSQSVAPAAQESAETTAPSTAAADPTDPFVQAVRIAEKAATDGQAAATPAEWLDLASRWQRASDLMGNVSSSDERFKTAQDRQRVYQQNSEAALQKAEQLRSSGD